MIFNTLILVLILLMSPNLILAADIEEYQTDSFKDIDIVVLNKQQKFGVEGLLLILDLDNTLLTTDTDLGGDIWYRWQTSGIDGLKAATDAKPVCLYDAIGMLFELTTMHPVEPAISAYLSRWKTKGLSMIIFTSRGTNYRAATERELKRNGLDITENALRPVGAQKPEFSYPALNQSNSKDVTNYVNAEYRHVSYANGIFMTTGAHRGAMLDQLLDKMSRNFHAIIAVDDAKANLDVLKESVLARGSLDLALVHYTKIETERRKEFGAILTKEHEKKMTEDWRILEGTLNRVFPNRKNSTCSY